MRAPRSHLLRLSAWYVPSVRYVRFIFSRSPINSLRGDRFVLKSDCREQILQNL